MTGLAAGLAALALLSCTGALPEKPLATAPKAAAAPAAAPAPAAAAAAEPDLATVYRNLAAYGSKVFRLLPEKSAVRIYAFRAGRAARLGHNHVISAPIFVGYLSLPPTGAADARFDLEFRLDQLELDRAEYRAPLGKAFAGQLSPEAVAATREHMLGADNLQADRFPYVRIHSVQISGEAPRFAAKIEVELHGQKRQLWLPLEVDGLPGKLAVAGSFVLRQSDFGIKPYAVLGGMLAVQDEVIIEFKLLGD